ncbi:MAG: phenylacetate--CoA ligase family protein, partial [Deltaproteobacteria bacterium]
MSAVDRNSGFSSPEETLGPDERRAYQERFLREIVSHAYAHGTPLKAAMDDRGISPDQVRTIEDLQNLPITKKSDLAAAQKINPPFGGYCTVSVADLARVHQSPGPIYDPIAREDDYYRWMTSLYSVGFRPGDLVVNTFAYHLTPAGHMFEDGVKALGATVVPTGVGNTEAQVNVMKDLGV